MFTLGDVGIIDTLIGFPHDNPDLRKAYPFAPGQIKDPQWSREYTSNIELLFRDIPERQLAGSADPVAVTLEEMDRWGIERGLIGVGDNEGVGEDALRRYPDRFIASSGCDPNQGMAGIRRLVQLHETIGLSAVGGFPAGTFPQVAIDDKKMYPIYAKCVELGLPFFCTTGVPGPRVPFAPQRVELVDEVMYDFPDLVFVMRHGAEPWVDLAVKLMLKWPGLHFCTSGFAPRYYPKAIIDYANTRGADKVMYGGFFPMGLSLERIMTELPSVPLKDGVWPKFLRHNAMRVLGLS